MGVFLFGRKGIIETTLLESYEVVYNEFKENLENLTVAVAGRKRSHL